MARLTEKMKQALVLLRQEHNPDTPAIVIYGKVTERGYTWNGNYWERSDGGFTLAYPAQIRIMCDGIIDATLLSRFIERALRDGGWNPDVSTARPNNSGNGYRVYITIE